MYFNHRQQATSNNKYNARKTIYNGIVFDSRKEMVRYEQLEFLALSGIISGLKRQVKYELIPAQREKDEIGKRGGVKKGKVIEKSVSYIADFVYTDEHGNVVVEDCKGYKQGGAYAVFTIKRKLMLQIYGIKIKEV